MGVWVGRGAGDGAGMLNAKDRFTTRGCQKARRGLSVGAYLKSFGETKPILLEACMRAGVHKTHHVSKKTPNPVLQRRQDHRTSR